MTLQEFLSKNKTIIINKWMEGILETYPTDTRRFFKKQTDRFNNPVGTTLSRETENLFQELVEFKDLDPVKVSPILDKIVRVRAIQDFSPSQTISLFFMLKKIIRDELKNDIRDNNLSDEMVLFETKVDEMALIAFDIYMKCRETLYEIRVDQAKKQVAGLLRRAGLIEEIPEWDPEKKEKNIINHQVIT